MTINALNFWLKVPNHSMDLIKSAVRMLHGSSLMSVPSLLPVTSQLR